MSQQVSIHSFNCGAFMEQSAVTWPDVCVCAHGHILGCVKGHGEAGRNSGEGLQGGITMNLLLNMLRFYFYIIF